MTRFLVTLFAVSISVEMFARYSGWVNSGLATLSNAILVTVTILFFRLMSGIEDPQKFTQVYLLSIVAKILLACILIVILILVDKSTARSNVLFLFLMYVLFTVIDVVFLIRLRRKLSGAKKNQKISF
jgi:hypothetical protein